MEASRLHQPHLVPRPRLRFWISTQAPLTPPTNYQLLDLGSVRAAEIHGSTQPPGWRDGSRRCNDLASLWGKEWWRKLKRGQRMVWLGNEKIVYGLTQIQRGTTTSGCIWNWWMFRRPLKWRSKISLEASDSLLSCYDLFQISTALVTENNGISQDTISKDRNIWLDLATRARLTTTCLEA